MYHFYFNLHQCFVFFKLLKTGGKRLNTAKSKGLFFPCSEFGILLLLRKPIIRKRYIHFLLIFNTLLILFSALVI